MSATKYITRAEMRHAHSHAMDDIIIPCFNRILLCVYLSKALIQIIPTQIDIKEGITNPIALNSRNIKSTIIGIKYNIPIPIISRPEFLATINKSVLLIYLIDKPSQKKLIH